MNKNALIDYYAPPPDRFDLYDFLNPAFFGRSCESFAACCKSAYRQEIRSLSPGCSFFDSCILQQYPWESVEVQAREKRCPFGKRV
jgi:hypothetical protein